MATTRFWKITNKLKNVIKYVDNDKKTSGEEAKSSDDIASTLHYATNERKTLTEEKLYVTSINCEVKTAAEEFEMVKKRYGKGHKILGYHGYMSFKEGEVTPDKAHMIGVEFAKRNFPGFQVVVATHLNTNHIHNHFVVNSVCMKDGHMAHDEVRWFAFHHMVDAIMREHSLSYIRFPKRLKEPDMRQRYITERYDSEQIKLIKEAVDEAIAESSTLEEMRQALRRMGYQYNLSPNRKYWTVTPAGGKKNFRLYHLGEEYTNRQIERRIYENAFKKIPKKKVKKVTILQYTGSMFEVVRLYRHYRYVLETIKREREGTRYLSPEVRADVKSIEKISEEIRFMAREKIETMSDLDSHEEKLNKEIDELLVRKRHVTRDIEKHGGNPELTKEKDMVNELIKTRRNERNMCKNIRKRSEKIALNISSDGMERRDNDEYGSRDCSNSYERDGKNRI